MKKIYILFIAFFTAIAMMAEDVEKRKASEDDLGDYKQQFKMIYNQIDSIQQYYESLPDTVKENKDIITLIRNINSEIKKIKMSKLKEKLAKANKTLSDSLNKVSQPQVTPKEKKVVPQPVRQHKDIRNSLRGKTLTQLHENDNSIRQELDGTEWSEVYEAILNLYNVEYKIYNRQEIRDVLAKVRAIKEYQLADNAHWEELQNKIDFISRYRFATIELQRLIGVLLQPDRDLIEKADAGDYSGEEIYVDVQKICAYLERQGETEFVKRYDYTNKTLEQFVKNPGERNKIKNDIDEALKSD